MTPEKQKKRNWLAIGWEFAFMNDRPCIIIAEHRLGKSNILLSSYEKEGAIEIKGYLKATDVAREVFAEIQAEIKAALDSNYKALPQVELSEELWSCVRGKIDCLRGLDDFIDELKKKWEVEE